MMEEKIPLSHELVCFQMLISGPQNLILMVSKSNSNISGENYFFLKNEYTSEGALSYNISYYQQLSIARYQVSFNANNYFE